LDVTKLFAAENTDAVMDITKMLTDESRVQNENDVTGASATRMFTNMSMSLEESLNDAANASEMDTAMIIDDNIFDSSDEKDSVKQPAEQPVQSVAPVEQVPADESSSESESDSESESEEPDAVVAEPVVTPVVFEDQESIADVSMSIVSDNIASQEASEKTKVFDDCEMEMTEAVDREKVRLVNEEEKTQVFSQGASITIEKNLSKDVSPPSSQEPQSQPTSSNKSQVAQKGEDVFQDKSTSFNNNRRLTLAFSRVSFPRNLDKVLKQRREQMNLTLHALKDADISSDMDSYSDSPRSSVHNESTAASIHVPDATSVVFEKTSIATENMDLSDAMDESVADVSEPEQSEVPAVIESQRHISPASESSGFLAPSTGSSVTSSQETDVPSDGSRKTAASKRSSDSHFLSSSMGFTSFDESGSESGDVSGFEDAVKGVANDNDDHDEEEEEDDLHEDSLFEQLHGAESSFMLSPDSSFHSSFICQDDTLIVLGDDIDAKLNEYIQKNRVDDEVVRSREEEDRDLTFVPLQSFRTKHNSVTLLTQDPQQLTALFLFSTIRLTIDLGATLRSFNGIPIKVIKRIGIESATKDPDFVYQDDGISLIDYWDEKNRGLIPIAHEMLISSFEEHKSSLISKYSTSDQLSDLLTEVSDLVKESGKFLQELALTSMLYPTQVYRKVGKVYDLAFQLPGRRRNFFLILAVDPSSYPFAPLKVRFGFDQADVSLYHVRNFAKALSLVVKPGKHYITRMIDAAKKYVLISRKISLAHK
jgi:hypothetical protein